MNLKSLTLKELTGSRHSRLRRSGIELGGSDRVVCAVDTQGRVTINGVPVYRIGPELRAANDAYDHRSRKAVAA